MNKILVNPYDIDEISEDIYAAYTLKKDERKKRMQLLRRKIKKQDIFWWVNSFLHASISKKLNNFPRIDDYLPEVTV